MKYTKYLVISTALACVALTSGSAAAEDRNTKNQVEVEKIPGSLENVDIAFWIASDIAVDKTNQLKLASTTCQQLKKIDYVKYGHGYGFAYAVPKTGQCDIVLSSGDLTSNRSSAAAFVPEAVTITTVIAPTTSAAGTSQSQPQINVTTSAPFAMQGQPTCIQKPLDPQKPSDSIKFACSIKITGQTTPTASRG